MRALTTMYIFQKPAEQEDFEVGKIGPAVWDREGQQGRRDNRWWKQVDGAHGKYAASIIQKPGMTGHFIVASIYPVGGHIISGKI